MLSLVYCFALSSACSCGLPYVAGGFGGLLLASCYSVNMSFVVLQMSDYILSVK